MKVARRATTRRAAALVAVAALLLAACSGSEREGAVPSTSSSTTGPAPRAVVDWLDAEQVVSFPGGWSVRSMDGDAPILAVERHGEVVGAVEANAYPVSSLDAGRDLHAIARDLYESSRRDRRQGCGYEIATAPIRDAVVGGQPGISYGFAGPAEPSPSERIISYATVSGEHVVIIVASAHDPGGCIGTDEEVLFDTATLAEFEPLLARIVADTPLPLEVLRLSGDGGDAEGNVSRARVVATDGGLEGGRLWLITDSQRARIAQPSPLEPSDAERLGLRIRSQRVELRVVGADTGSSFVVMPADGSDASLYLRLDRELYPVELEPVSQAEIEALELDSTITSRVAIASAETGTP